MIKKETQIKEMADALCENCRKHLILGVPCERSCCRNAEHQAKALYEIGFRKVEDYETVIIKQEYENLMRTVNPRKTQKETAKEIVEKLALVKSKIIESGKIFRYSDVAEIVQGIIKEVTEKYGLEELNNG